MEEQKVQEQAPENGQQKVTHVAMPLQVFNDIAVRLGKLPHDLVRPIIDLLEKNSVPVTGIISNPVEPVEEVKS